MIESKFPAASRVAEALFCCDLGCLEPACFAGREGGVLFAEVFFRIVFFIGAVSVQQGQYHRGVQKVSRSQLRPAAGSNPSLLKRNEIAESNRNRSELRAHRVHESDMDSAGFLRGLWLNRKTGTAVPAGADSRLRAIPGGPTSNVKPTRIGRSHSNPTSWNERIRAQEEDAQKIGWKLMRHSFGS